jgi:hypothetical protein
MEKRSELTLSGRINLPAGAAYGIHSLPVKTDKYMREAV